MNGEQIRETIKKAGGASWVAKQADMERVGVYKWIYNQSVPAERVQLLSRLSGVPTWKIRPDIFLPPNDKPNEKPLSVS